MSNWKYVAKLSEIRAGEPVLVDFEYETAAVYRCGDELFAIEDRCTHDDGPLADGVVDGCEVICPRHGARFDIQSGKALSMPAVEDVQTYAVRVDGEDVYVLEPDE